jgi:hypothetical protein
MLEDLLLNTRVYKIEREGIKSYRIYAQSIFLDDSKFYDEFKFYTFKTKRDIMKILEIYENKEGKDINYPEVIIIPTPPYGTYSHPIPLDGNFSLAIGYTGEIPLYVHLNNLIITSDITIYGKKDKLKEMNVIGFCGTDTFNKNTKPRSYIINLKKAKSDDIIAFIKYNIINPKIIEKTEMKKNGWYIIIKGENVCEDSEITPKVIKILDIYM